MTSAFIMVRLRNKNEMERKKIVLLFYHKGKTNLMIITRKYKINVMINPEDLKGIMIPFNFVLITFLKYIFGELGKNDIKIIKFRLIERFHQLIFFFNQRKRGREVVILVHC